MKSTFYNIKLGCPETVLEQLLESVKKADLDSFMYAITINGLEPYEIKIMANNITEQKNKLSSQIVRLKKFGETFNKRFITENDKCFSTALRLMRKINSGIRGAKEIFLRLSPRKHRSYRDYIRCKIPKPSIYNSSYLSPNTNYSKDLFDLEVFIPEVKTLFIEMTSFFDILVDGIMLCKKIISEENFIRNNPKLANALFEEYKSKILYGISSFRIFMTDEAILASKKNNPIVQMRKKFLSQEPFAQEAFHNSPEEPLNQMILAESVEAEKNLKISAYEQSCWGTDAEYIKKIRFLIANFDNLSPNIINNKYLDTEYIVVFMAWCGLKNNEEKFVEYFTDIYKKNGGVYEVAKYSGFNKAKNLMSKEDFNIKMNELAEYINDYMQKSTKGVQFKIGG